MGFSYKRSTRVGDLILKEISNMITKGEIKDPRVSSVVLTNVYLSADMGFARFYFTTLTPELDINEVSEGLKSSTGFIRKKLSKRLRLKKIPKVEFEFDTVLEKGYKVDGLIKEIVGE